MKTLRIGGIPAPLRNLLGPGMARLLEFYKRLYLSTTL